MRSWRAADRDFRPDAFASLADRGLVAPAATGDGLDDGQSAPALGQLVHLAQHGGAGCLVPALDRQHPLVDDQAHADDQWTGSVRDPDRCVDGVRDKFRESLAIVSTSQVSSVKPHPARVARAWPRAMPGAVGSAANGGVALEPHGVDAADTAGVWLGVTTALPRTSSLLLVSHMSLIRTACRKSRYRGEYGLVASCRQVHRSTRHPRNGAPPHG